MGLLGSTDEVLLTTVRKKYAANYKAAWRKRQRQEKSEFTVALTDSEVKLISEFARKHNRSITRFILESSKAYIRGHLVIADLIALNLIRQELALNYDALQRLFDESVVSYDVGARLLKQMEVLEQTLITHLHTPVSLNQLITDAVCSDPSYKEVISQLLQTLKCDH